LATQLEYSLLFHHNSYFLITPLSLLPLCYSAHHSFLPLPPSYSITSVDELSRLTTSTVLIKSIQQHIKLIIQLHYRLHFDHNHNLATIMATIKRKQLKGTHKISRSLKKSIKKNLVKIVEKREREVREEEVSVPVPGWIPQPQSYTYSCSIAAREVLRSPQSRSNPDQKSSR
jgi:hypothetical protein